MMGTNLGGSVLLSLCIQSLEWKEAFLVRNWVSMSDNLGTGKRKGLGEKKASCEKMNIWKCQLLQLLQGYLPALWAWLESICGDRFAEKETKPNGASASGMTLLSCQEQLAVFSLGREQEMLLNTDPESVAVRDEMPVWHKGSGENVWHFTGIPGEELKQC